ARQMDRDGRPGIHRTEAGSCGANTLKLGATILAPEIRGQPRQRASPRSPERPVKPILKLRTPTEKL
ncbi:MAG TPA: hypothetical protein VIM36_04410, partial [Gemmatimonadaceae bacterium]